MPILDCGYLRTGASRPELAANLGYETMAATAKRDARSAAGKIKPVIDSWYPLAQAGEAQARMKSSQHIRKILLAV